MIGGGSAIEALENEAATGLPTNGVWHDQKISDLSIHVDRWVSRHSPTHPDFRAAQNLLTAMVDALRKWKNSPYVGRSGHTIP